MKQPKKLTRSQKIQLSKKGYDPAEYGLHGEVGSTLIFINLKTKEKLVIPR